MARIEGKCACGKVARKDDEFASCVCRKANKDKNTWVDVLSGLCRDCETNHVRGLHGRWGVRS